MTTLTIQQLSKRSGNSLLLPEINLDIHAGQCVVIQCNNELGHLLIQLIIGRIPASNGHITLNSIDLRQNSKQISHKLGISLLEDGIYERLKVKDYLLFFRNLYNASSSIEEVLRKVGLYENMQQKVSTLTFSQRKRLQLARCVVHNPVLLILEEPEQNVDIESHIIIRSLITELCQEGKAVLITTSYLADAVSITNDVYRLTETEFKKIDVAEEPETQEEAATKLEPLTDQAGRLLIDQTQSTENEPNSAEQLISTEKVAAEHVNTLSQLSEQEQAALVEGVDKHVLVSKQIVETIPVRIEKIPAKVEDKIILFDPTEINYIESSDGMCLLQVKGEAFPCTFTLNELEQKLRAFGFFRCHRSYIVNLQKVREVITWSRNSYSLILDDQKKSSIPLSKGKYDDLKATLGI